jgi:hypothetical protein
MLPLSEITVNAGPSHASSPAVERRYHEALLRGEEVAPLTYWHPAAASLRQLRNIITVKAYAAILRSRDAIAMPSAMPYLLIAEGASPPEYRLVTVIKAMLVKPVDRADINTLCWVQIKGSTMLIVPADTLIYFKDVARNSP